MSCWLVESVLFKVGILFTKMYISGIDRYWGLIFVSFGLVSHFNLIRHRVHWYVSSTDKYIYKLFYFTYHPWLVYLPTFTVNINHSGRSIYQSHGWYGYDYGCFPKLGIPWFSNCNGSAVSVSIDWQYVGCTHDMYQQPWVWSTINGKCL